MRKAQFLSSNQRAGNNKTPWPHNVVMVGVRGGGGKGEVGSERRQSKFSVSCGHSLFKGHKREIPVGTFVRKDAG